jgi:DNA ligase-1
MRFAELALVSDQVAGTSRRGEKTALLANLLRSLAPEESAVAVGLLTGRPRQGRIGVGWSALSKLDAPPADEPSLEVLEIDRWLSELAVESGAGSVARRRELLSRVFSRATASEQRLLWGVFSGELRQGALEGVMVDAIARGAGVPLDEVRRAAMFSGDLGETARKAFDGGVDALRTVTFSPGRAVGPMLASPAEDVADALAQTGTASVEWKLDGARVQAHRRDGDVRLFTRNLNEITDRLPGVVALVAGLPGGDLVLDGEVAGLTEGLGGAQDLRLGGPRRFQDTMGDFSAQAAAGRGGGLAAYFFDVLHAGGTSLVDEPLSARRDVLAALVPSPYRLPSIVTGDAGEASAFMDDAVARGLEGVMVKDLASSYAAGRRGGSWRKVKPVLTFDLVVLAAEWGHGRRQGWLSNLHLGARGDDGFVMVGKTFKGMTDELLRWQTEELQRIAITTQGHVVHVRPERVVEVAIDGVQRSPRYPGGVALRFARIRRYRPDKSPADADRIEALQALL